MGQHILNAIITFFGPIHAWADPIYAWLKDWQTLLSSLLAVFAACIFAASILKAAHILATKDAQPRPRAAENPFPDLRDLNLAVPSQNDQPADMARSLDQLRSLVRSALSAATPSEGAAVGSNGVSHLSYERILRMRFEKSALPQTAPQSADELVESLSQHIEMLGAALRKKASPSELSNALIKVNAIARSLSAAITSAPAAETPPSSPSSRSQQ